MLRIMKEKMIRTVISLKVIAENMKDLEDRMTAKVLKLSNEVGKLKSKNTNTTVSRIFTIFNKGE